MASLDIYSQLVSLDGAPLGQTQDARVLENVMHLNDAHDIFFFFCLFGHYCARTNPCLNTLSSCFVYCSVCTFLVWMNLARVFEECHIKRIHHQTPCFICLSGLKFQMLREK